MARCSNENNYLEPPKVLNDGVVAAMNGMMRSVIEHGTGKNARLAGWEAAGKTGTTQSFRDALFVGYTSNLTTGIWFGNDDGQSMKKVTGGGLPAKAWHDFMTAAHQGLAPAPLPGGDFIEPAPAEDPMTIGTIISDVLQGGGEERYSGDPVYAEQYPNGRTAAIRRRQRSPGSGSSSRGWGDTGHAANHASRLDPRTIAPTCGWRNAVGLTQGRHSSMPGQRRTDRRCKTHERAAPICSFLPVFDGFPALQSENPLLIYAT